MSNNPAIYLIHGDTWKAEDLKDAIQYCRGLEWSPASWKPRAALVDSAGITTEYVGQGYDPEKLALVTDGLTHDHCEVCSWTLTESSDPAVGSGHTHDGRTWLCTECFELFLASPFRDEEV